MNNITSSFTDPVTRGAAISGQIKKTLSASVPELVRSYLAEGGRTPAAALQSVMRQGSRHFILAGVDLMVVEHRETGQKGFLILEVNSAPGFVYCTPELDAAQYGYGALINLLLEHTPRDQWDGIVHLSEGKVPVEDLGFSHYYRQILKRDIKILGPRELAALGVNSQGQLEYADRPITGAIRYLHADPWNYLGPDVQGTFINTTKVDLCGGRDKLMAETAFEECRVDQQPLFINRPPCYSAINKEDLVRIIQEKRVPLVVKKRFLNSGIGIYFVINQDLGVLDELTDQDFPIVVQQMITAPGMGIDSDFPWEQKGVIIDGERYAYDLRVVIASYRDGYRPLMVYARRGRSPFTRLNRGDYSPEVFDDIFKVNIAKKSGSGFVFESNRLILPTDAGWEQLGITESELKAAYAESALAVYGVDQLCCSYEGRYQELLSRFQPGS